ncbi:MAG TPA: Gmad2 immunoglobulin-like domain-containing protein [Gaiellaceae bacterium]|nr:Gmad2 immunoglobulin-like domain-containing protein [Gaiellaceae bacterium]
MKRALLLALAVALLAGCGGRDEAATTPSHVYFLRDGKVWPVAREVDRTRVHAGTVEALFEGPTADEREALDATTAIPGGGPTITTSEGVTTLTNPQGEYSRKALAQIVYTLTQFPTVKKVEVGGKRYTRADFEDQTPGILVESPLPFEDVASPIRATGTANTFEATFNYELTDTDGKIVDENFVTATSGTGTRGTFDFTTKKFTVPFSGVGSLVVFERSAEDGSRTKLVEIPLRMSQ